MHTGEGPTHNERSASAAADSSAEIVEPSAAEVCDADADPEIETLVSLTLILSVNEGVETATDWLVSTGLGAAFGLLSATTPDAVSEMLSSVYVAVEVPLGDGVAVAVAVGVAPPVEVAVGVAVAVMLAVAVTDEDGVGLGVDVGVATPLPLSSTV